METINKTLIDKDIHELFEEIKWQLCTNWIYLHFDILKAIEKRNCFEGYEFLQQLNKDGSCTQLIKVTFKEGPEQNISIYIENCKLGELSYYIIHSIEVGQERILPCSNPQGALFLKTLTA